MRVLQWSAMCSKYPHSSYASASLGMKLERGVRQVVVVVSENFVLPLLCIL